MRIIVEEAELGTLVWELPENTVALIEQGGEEEDKEMIDGMLRTGVMMYLALLMNVLMLEDRGSQPTRMLDIINMVEGLRKEIQSISMSGSTLQ